MEPRGGDSLVCLPKHQQLQGRTVGYVAFFLEGMVSVKDDKTEARSFSSGHSGMYPYQRTPMGNPYIRPIYIYIVGIYG